MLSQATSWIPALQLWCFRLAPRVLTALLLSFAFWLAGLALEASVVRVGQRRSLDPDLGQLLARLVRLSLVAFGLVTAVGTLGIDIKALVTGLGLTGFALGFALKDIIANSLAGILILFYKPFRRGHHIDVAGSVGRVEGINLRYTILMAEGGTRILVPNSTLFTNSIRVDSTKSSPPDAALADGESV